jgi:1-acyl-sn-glycerol-3-phosphate acyltransferase
VAGKIIGGVKSGYVFLSDAALIVWTMTSAVAYGFIAMLVGAFSRRLARKVARLWCVHLLFVTRVKLIVQGASNINHAMNYIFIANHQGYFDIPVLYTGLGSMIAFIAKKELFRIPFFGWGMAAIGCISMDRKNPRSARTAISKAVSLLRKNNMSLVLFPEGTRSQSEKVGEFKRGSFTLALEAGLPVVPVAICGTNAIHNKKSNKIRPGAVTIIIGTSIPTDEVQKMNKEELSGIVREIIAKTMEENCREQSTHMVA